jgi:hypothetical protein
MCIGSSELIRHGWLRVTITQIFFHAQTSERKKRNTINKLKDEGGREVAGKLLKTFIANQYQ